MPAPIPVYQIQISLIKLITSYAYQISSTLYHQWSSVALDPRSQAHVHTEYAYFIFLKSQSFIITSTANEIYIVQN